MFLRKLKPADADKMAKLLTDPIIGKTYMLPDYPNEQAVYSLFQRMLSLSNDPARYIRGIELEGTLIGFLNDTQILDSSIELGYAMDPQFHNQGHMTQALQAAILELFQLGYHTVLCGAFEENTPSIRVMQKCGMQRLEKTDQIEYRGIAHRCVYYCIERKA